MKKQKTHLSIKNFFLRTLLLAFLLTSGFIPARALGTPQTVQASTVKLSVKKKKLTEGSSLTLSLKGASGKIKWSSKNKSIAAVDKNGTVTAVSAGKTVIKAKNKGTVYKCKITVLPGKENLEESDGNVQNAESESTYDDKKTSGYSSKEEETSRDRLNEMIAKCEDRTVGDTIYQLNTRYIVYSDSDLVQVFMQAALNYSEFSVLFTESSLIPTEYELSKQFPAFESISYAEIIKFANGYGVRMCVDKGYLYDDDIRVISIIRGGDTSFVTEEDQTAAQAILSAAASLKGISDYQTVKNIHDYLVSNTVYTNTGVPRCHTIKACILDRKCVCDGYAKTFRLLCEANGIPCLFVPGIANGGDHAWNKVLIDGSWYNVDCTFDDPVPDSGPGVVSHNYFCLTDEVFESSGYVWEHADFPVADSNTYDENISLFNSIPHASNHDELKSAIDSMLGAGHEFFKIALTDKDLYNEVLSLVSTSPNKPRFNGSIEASMQAAGSYGYVVTISIIRR